MADLRPVPEPRRGSGPVACTAPWCHGHRQRCLFGRMHDWSTWYENGRLQRTRGTLHCHACGGVCTGEEPPPRVVRIDQARISDWIAANPAELRGRPPAVYPRPLSWWQSIMPGWVHVAEQPGGIIVLTPARTGGTAPQRRARDEALQHWLRGNRPLAYAIIEET